MEKKVSTQLKEKKKNKTSGGKNPCVYPNNAENWSKDAELFTSNNMYNAQRKKEFAKKCLGNC